MQTTFGALTLSSESCTDINNRSSDQSVRVLIMRDVKLLTSHFNFVFLLRKVILFQDIEISLKVSVVSAISYTSPRAN